MRLASSGPQEDNGGHPRSAASSYATDMGGGNFRLDNSVASIYIIRDVA